jgi:hypothetical protein
VESEIIVVIVCIAMLAICVRHYLAAGANWQHYPTICTPQKGRNAL